MRKTPVGALKSALAVLFIVTLGSAGPSDAGETRRHPFPGLIDQFTIHTQPVERIHEWGERLFHAKYNSLDGIGANLALDPPGSLISQRFARSPRADLPGWVANKRRPDGPQAQSCAECHNEFPGNVSNEQRDPFRTTDIRMWISRQPTDLHGAGALQLLGEQSSKEIWAIRDNAIAEARRLGTPVTAELLTSNDVSYGFVTANPDGSLDLSRVEGLDPFDDGIVFTKALSVKPFHLKGIVSFLRFFVAGAADVTLGMQSPERVSDLIDGDSDGVLNEFSSGDIASMVIYIAADERPVTKLELHDHLGGKFKLSPEEIASIKNGERVFEQVGCAGCHRPVLRLKDATFREPSQTPGFHLTQFGINEINFETGTTEGFDPKTYGYDLNNQISFDLTANPAVGRKCEKILKGTKVPSGRAADCFLQFPSDGRGGAYVWLYGDMKRHDMGAGLAEPIDEFVGKSIWRTKELWGVGSAGPWLHDGRATTLTEAILWHGGEGEASRVQFETLSEAEQDDLLAFLRNLVLYDPDQNRIFNNDL